MTGTIAIYYLHSDDGTTKVYRKATVGGLNT